MFLLRNKVLLNKGNLSITQIKWFYPTSMVQHQIDGLKKIWNELYKKYFGGNAHNIEGIPESVAPYRYYKTNQGAQSSVLTIDIGGETSDIFVVEDSNTGCIAAISFKNQVKDIDVKVIRFTSNHLVDTTDFEKTDFIAKNSNELFNILNQAQ